MRWRAQEIATRELGPRTELDVARERSKELTRHGFTLIDRMLGRHVADGNRLMPKRLATLVPPERAACLGRLATLEKVGIARQEAGGAWRLKPGWDDDLKRMEVISEAPARLLSTSPTAWEPASCSIPARRSPRWKVWFAASCLHDELAGTMYVVVQGRDGVACYVPVRPEVAAELATGDIVRVSSPSESWVKAADRIVARFAAEHSGLYDLAAHQAALVLRAGRGGGEQRPSLARRPSRATEFGWSGWDPCGKSIGGGQRSRGAAAADRSDRDEPFDERAFREVVADELRRVLREEQVAGNRPANGVEYMPVAVAAARAAVAPVTIRAWKLSGNRPGGSRSSETTARQRARSSSVTW
jgi:hypothetical protein